ncbi:hypothetical protein Btru_028691 [Bulinus truncatus]|nr:hypothetical protein Btru_028691 [Bulinus truncatus]
MMVSRWHMQQKELEDKLQAEVNQKFETPDCLQQPSFIAVIATMGGVILILLVLSIVVTMRLIKANKKKSGNWQHQLTNLPRPSFTSSGR